MKHAIFNPYLNNRNDRQDDGHLLEPFDEVTSSLKHRRNSNHENLGDSEFDETNQKVNEVYNYLDENITEQAGPNTDTF
nr:11976_t:CDS:2 [Entrophospora candida]